MKISVMFKERCFNFLKKIKVHQGKIYSFKKRNKELFIKIKWILSHAKPIIPYFLFTIVINVIFSLVGVYNIIVSKSLIDSAISGNTSEVILWLSIMIIIAVLSMIINPITSLMNTKTSIKLNNSIQLKLYSHITNSEWLYESKFHSISLLTRITSDVGNISSTLLGTIPAFISLITTFIAALYTLISWAPSIALTALFIGPLLVLLGKIFSKRLKSLYKEAQEEDVKYRTFMQESMQNIMIIKTFCMEKINLQRLIKIQKNKYNISMRNTKLSAMTSISMSTCSSMIYFTIFGWGVLNISKGLTTYGTFTGLLQLYGKVQAPFSTLSSMLPGFISCIAATERLMEIESLPLEKENSLLSCYSFKAPCITFNSVSFEYNENHKVLNNISFNIEPGEILALVGSSGEGKTTILRLILSLITPSNGEIYLTENNLLENLSKSHRQYISYVPQGNTLFSGTIEENLRYGNPDADDTDLKSALKDACLLDFVEKLKEGVKTKLGERGVGISEGQAQRIAIARAFLRKRPVLILDEATSSLDPETEIMVLKSIYQLSYKPTCIIITHRPSALSMCNRIIKLEKGSINEVSKDSIVEVACEFS